MAQTLLLVLLVAYVPGALMFRLPVLDRRRRESLPADERTFWAIVLSILQSSFIGFGLAAASWYRFDRLLWANVVTGVLILLIGRGGLRLGPAAPRPRWSMLLPLGLAAGGLWITFFVPPAEYVMGGKDPGVYINEGIQIAQRGTLVVGDETVATLPVPYRSLFFKTSDDPTYYSNRFMGFFVLDPNAGSVVGQFPHLYPTWVAIGYGINGLSGAREVIGLWSVLGLLALYFLGARIVGRAAATAGAALLALNVVQIWYGRYPNAEMVMQPLVLAAALAFVHAESDDDRFFAPVSAVLLVLSLFAHLTGILAIGALGAVAVVAPLRTRGARLSFWMPLVLGTCLAGTYLARYIPPYFGVPVEFIRTLRPLAIALLVVSAVLAVLAWRVALRFPVRDRVRWLLLGLVAVGVVLAAYAYFLRTAGGLLAEHDANSLRDFAAFYLSGLGLIAAVAGLAFVAPRLPEGFPFFVLLAAYSFFTFYKIRIIPEHFWAARRFVAVILPGALLLVGAAAFSRVGHATAGLFARRETRLARYALGLVVVLVVGSHYWSAARPILGHVEYAGLIPRLEKLAATVGENDLVVVEARAGSDVHVLGLPLAYIYARHVLVLADTSPNKAQFRDFLSWARTRYRRVFFVGGGGTELLSRTMTVKAIDGTRFQIPEYESARDAYPQGVRFKEFDLGVYEFLPQPAPADHFDLDVGTSDDLYVRRFHAKEQGAGFSFRWSRDVSYISIVGAGPACQALTIWLSGSGRPPGAGAAAVSVFLNDRPLGSVTAASGVLPYRFSIPAELADAMGRSEDAAQLRLVSATWSPRRLLGVPDDRLLGVMVDRVALDCSAPPLRR